MAFCPIIPDADHYYEHCLTPLAMFTMSVADQQLLTQFTLNLQLVQLDYLIGLLCNATLSIFHSVKTCVPCALPL